MSGSDMTGTVMGAAGTAATGVGMVAGAHVAAGAAKAAGQTDWRMSTMGQLAASMLSRAPVTGSAYGAYTGVVRSNWNDENRKPQQQYNQKGAGTSSTPSGQQDNTPDTLTSGSSGTPFGKQSSPQPAPSAPPVISSTQDTTDNSKNSPKSVKAKTSDPQNNNTRGKD